MKKTTATNQPPQHLRAGTAAWFKQVVAEYNFDSHHYLLLTKACEAFDRSEEAREAIAKHGAIYEDRFGAPRARPEIAIERDSRLAFARALYENSALMLPSQRKRACQLARLSLAFVNFGFDLGLAFPAKKPRNYGPKS